MMSPWLWWSLLTTRGHRVRCLRLRFAIEVDEEDHQHHSHPPLDSTETTLNQQNPASISIWRHPPSLYSIDRASVNSGRTCIGWSKGPDQRLLVALMDGPMSGVSQRWNRRCSCSTCFIFLASMRSHSSSWDDQQSKCTKSWAIVAGNACSNDMIKHRPK